MTTRAKELIAVGAIFGIATICYLGKTVWEWEPLMLSVGMSFALSGLVAISLIYILILTIKGKPVGRRTVFVYVGLAVSIPFFMSLEQKISPAPEVRLQFENLEKLTPGSKILISFDYDPASAPELQPMAVAVLRYCFDNDLKPIIIGLWPQGPQQAELALAEVLASE